MNVLTSFGRTNAPVANVIAPGQGIAMLRDRRIGDPLLLAYGNGRSYGDSCLNAAGSLIDMRTHNRILGLDADTGVIEAQAGALLSEIIDYAAPYGFFPPVVPGTKFVTLGGAIANDVHGKNHHRRGTFGCHVEQLVLQRSDQQVVTCSRQSNPQLFAATIGGMGLTGLILSASIRLMRVASTDIVETVVPFGTLERYFDLAEAADAANEYAVAWIDQLAGGPNAGRGLLITGNHAEAVDGRPRQSRRRRLAVPFQPPITLLNRVALRAFNKAYRWSKSRGSRSRRVLADSFFFPLDGVHDWNRLYGPRGLFQHQSAVPLEAARQVVPEMLRAARDAGQGSFLTVLKRFGDVPSPGILSFPRPGFTLTLDFPNRGVRTLALLDRLDRLAVEAGGAVNPYKDARMGAQTFAASFPDWRRLDALRDPAFMSDFWARTAMRLERETMAEAAE